MGLRTDSQRTTATRERALHELADQALSRVAGAVPIPGNRLRILRDAGENYPAWIDSIRSAKKWIHFESYIIHEDDTGRQFAELLTAKARQGIQVRLLYDWIGVLGNTSRGFWRRLAKAGVDVRCFNPPSLESPFGWTSRDHRKMLSVDGRIGYVTGLCVGQPWVGYPERSIEPWRDTGVEIEGPALAHIDVAFADVWSTTGSALPEEEIPSVESIPWAGDVAVRIVGSIPNVAGIYRLDQLLATLAQRTIWLSDAYFVGTTAYVQALRAAARAGVDVRLLVPGAYDVAGIRALSRAGLRPLLEAGVRVFEWNGSMMHAKTAVVDGRWARIGSTNLNLASWIANWELDVVVEDKRIAAEMEGMFLDDLTHSTEIVLKMRHRIRRPQPVQPGQRWNRIGRGSGSRTAVGVVRLGHAVGAAITDRRELGPAEAVIMFWAAILLVAFSAAALYWPRGVIVPIVFICVWTAISLLVRAYKLRTKAHTGAKFDRKDENAT